MKVNFFIISLVSIVLFILIVFFVGLKGNNIYNTKNLVEKKINPFELTSIKEKIIINENDLKKNNFTLINFWASWCAPCIHENPILLKLKNNYNLKILGISYKDKKKNTFKFLNKYGNPYYFVSSDTLGKMSIDFGIYGIPESILIDKNLNILKKFIGPLDEEDVIEILKIIN
ncbi:DsbE family thiol:disulfide interchange protein [Pelagibacteraceae bacterium]|nr:DsbE family thiol:disulfide interchange protein [Pelagibacteraceae bacterium]